MLDINNLSKYSNDQIKGQLNNLKLGHRLYWLVTLIFIILSIALGVASIVVLSLYFSHIKETQTMFIAATTLLAFFIPCIIVMLAMIITDKIKFIDKIKIIQAYIKKNNIR